MERIARQRLHDQMERLSKGDRSAFDPVFRSVLPIVETFSKRMVHPADAGDVAQQTLLDVFENAAAFDPSRDALSFILGIAAYKAKTARQKRTRRKEACIEQEQVDDRTPEQLVLSADLRAALEEVLGTLAPTDVETIEAVLERRKRPSIAPATFRKRVERALGRLRRAWGVKHGTE